MISCHGVALVCCCLLSCFLAGDANGKLTFIHTYLNIKQLLVKLFCSNHHRQTPSGSPANFLSRQVERIDHPVSRIDFSEAGFDEGLSSKTLYES